MYHSIQQTILNEKRFYYADTNTHDQDSNDRAYDGPHYGSDIIH